MPWLTEPRHCCAWTSTCLLRLNEAMLFQVIIGDEILSAKVEDVNTRFLCSELRSIGWQVCRVSGPRARLPALFVDSQLHG